MKPGRIFHHFSRYPAVMLGLVLAGIGAAVFFGKGNAKIDSTVQAVLLQDAPEKKQFDALLEKFGSDEILVIALTHDDLFAASTVEKSLKIVRAIERMPGVRQVKSLYTAKNIRANGDDLEISKLMPSSDASAEERMNLRQAALSDRLFQKNLISLDGRTSGTLIFFEPNATEAQKEAISSYALDVAEEFSGPEQIHVSGSPAIKVQMSRLTRKSFAIVIIPALLVCGLITGLLTKSAGAFFATVLIGIFSLIGTVMTWFALGNMINPFTAVSPLVLLVVALAYSVHSIVRFREVRNELARSRRRDRKFFAVVAKRSYATLTRPLWYICVTTMVGFASLTTAKIPAVREMGLVLALGLPITFLICLFFGIPFLQLAKAFKEPSVRVNSPERRQPFTRLLADFAHDKAHAIGFVTAALCIMAVIGINKLEVQSNTFDWFPDKAQARKAEAAIQANLMSTSTINLYVLTDRKDAAVEPEFLKKAESLQNVILRDPQVDGVLSLVDYVKQLNESANQGNYSAFRIPNSKNLIKQYFFVLSDPDSIERLTDSRYTSLRFFIRTKTRDSAGLKALKERIVSQAEAIYGTREATIRAGSTLYFIGEGFDLIAETMIYSVLSALALMFFIIAYMMRSFSKAAIVMIPNVVPIFCTYGMMGMLGFRLDYAISTVACSLLGIAVDDSIHFTQTFEKYAAKGMRWRQVLGLTFRHTGKAMILTTVILVSGLAIFSLAESKWMIAFGTAMVFGIVACLFSDLFLLPPLLQRYYERRIEKLSYEVFYDVLLPAERQALRHLSRPVIFQPGEDIVDLDHNPQNVFFIQEGTAAISFMRARRDGKDVVQQVGAADCIGEFHSDVGAFTYYRATALTQVKALSVPSNLISDLCLENGHAKLMMDNLFKRRAAASGDKALVHNARIFSAPWYQLSMFIQAAAYLFLKHVVFRLFRVKVEWPEGLCLSKVSGNIVLATNHHFEFDAALTGLAVSDLGIVSPHRSPFFLANGRFWLGNFFTRMISLTSRLIIIQKGQGMKTQQYGFQYIRNLFKPHQEATVFVFPWACTPVGTVNASGKQTIPWIVENLDCTILPVCMIGMEGNPLKALFRSLFKPLKWRVGLPMSSKELLQRHGSAEKAEYIIARHIVLLSEGTLKLADAVTSEKKPGSRAA